MNFWDVLEPLDWARQAAVNFGEGGLGLLEGDFSGRNFAKTIPGIAGLGAGLLTGGTLAGPVGALTGALTQGLGKAVAPQTMTAIRPEQMVETLGGDPESWWQNLGVAALTDPLTYTGFGLGRHLGSRAGRAAEDAASRLNDNLVSAALARGPRYETTFDDLIGMAERQRRELLPPESQMFPGWTGTSLDQAAAANASARGNLVGQFEELNPQWRGVFANQVVGPGGVNDLIHPANIAYLRRPINRMPYEQADDIRIDFENLMNDTGLDPTDDALLDQYVAHMREMDDLIPGDLPEPIIPPILDALSVSPETGGRFLGDIGGPAVRDWMNNLPRPDLADIPGRVVFSPGFQGMMEHNPQIRPLMSLAMEEIEQPGPRMVLADFLEETSDTVRSELLRGAPDIGPVREPMLPPSGDPGYGTAWGMAFTRSGEPSAVLPQLDAAVPDIMSTQLVRDVDNNRLFNLVMGEMAGQTPITPTLFQDAHLLDDYLGILADSRNGVPGGRSDLESYLRKSLDSTFRNVNGLAMLQGYVPDRLLNRLASEVPPGSSMMTKGSAGGGVQFRAPGGAEIGLRHVGYDIPEPVRQSRFPGQPVGVGLDRHPATWPTAMGSDDGSRPVKALLAALGADDQVRRFLMGGSRPDFLPTLTALSGGWAMPSLGAAAGASAPVFARNQLGY